VGELKADGELEIIASDLILAWSEEGVVVNIESTVQSIQRAVEEAELMAAAKSTRYTRHCRKPREEPNSHGIVAIKDRRSCRAMSSG